MNPQRRDSQTTRVSGTSALDPSEATITWLSSVGYDAPPTPVEYDSRPTTVATPPSGLSVHHGSDETSHPDPWAPVARRRSTITRNWSLIGAFATAAAVLTILASTFVTPSYSASSVIRVTSGEGALTSRDSVTASNDLAAQFSQLIATSAVKSKAAALAGEPISAIEGNVSATVLANQNLIQITAKSDNGPTAARIAQAAADVLTTVAEASLTDTVSPVLKQQLAALDASIKDMQEQADRAQLAALRATMGSNKQLVNQSTFNGLVNQLSQLRFRRIQLQQDTALNRASRVVLLAKMGSSGPPQKDSPRPLQYGLIAFAVAAVLGSQILVSFFSGNRRGA